MIIKEIDYYFDRYYKNPISQEITKNIVHDKFKFNFDDTKKNHQVIQKWWDRGHLFEKDVSSFLTRILKPGDIAIDVGANIGVHSILMNRLIGEGKGGKVISIEPGKEAFEELKENMKVNSFLKSDCRNLILGEKMNESIFFHVSKEDSGMSYSVKKIDNPDLNWKKMNVSTLDNELKKLKKIKVVKIDIEGSEVKVLRGANSLLKKHTVKYWIVEYARNCLLRHNDSLHTLRKLMKSHGLDMFLLETNGGLPKYIPENTFIYSHIISNLLFTKIEHLDKDWIADDITSSIVPEKII